MDRRKRTRIEGLFWPLYYHGNQYRATNRHDKRDVAFLSTNVSPDEPSRPVPHIHNRQNVNIEKPRVSDVYTAHMGGVDRADQLRSFYCSGWQSKKWYKYLFWFLFNVSVCNAFVLESEHA